MPVAPGAISIRSPIAHANRAELPHACWSAGLLSFLLLPGSLWGQQTRASHDDGFATAIATDSAADIAQPGAAELMNSIGFMPNWKQLLSLAAGDDDNDPRKRFFVSYEQMLFGTSPTPLAGVIESKSPHAGQPMMSAASLGDNKSFSATALENLGAGVLGSLVPNLGTGSRLEFGRMEADNTGWSVSILDLNNSGPNAPSQDGNRAARQR